MRIHKTLIFFFSILLLYTIQFSNTKINADYNSLLAIESGKKLYKKKHYNDALSTLLKVASITKNTKIKAEAVMEIAYVKFLMGYSSQSYGVFIKRSLDLYKNIELSSSYHKSFKKVFAAIKEKYSPINMKSKPFNESIIRVSKSETQNIKDMELRNNLMFKMKKELSTLKEANRQQQDSIKKLEQELLELKKIKKKNKHTISNMKKTILSGKNLREKNYKLQYEKIRNEKSKMEKLIIEKDNIINKLSADIKNLLPAIKQPDAVEIKKSINSNSGLKENNVFEKLHQIWRIDSLQY